MTEVEPVLDFASSGRTGRRNALPDILGSPEYWGSLWTGLWGLPGSCGAEEWGHPETREMGERPSMGRSAGGEVLVVSSGVGWALGSLRQWSCLGARGLSRG
uniref:Uncharacterized protein n=1 Tax=Pelusios castaneus TaxID=367368 RepID=A0A8C8RCL9_9SAUR